MHMPNLLQTYTIYESGWTEPVRVLIAIGEVAGAAKAGITKIKTAAAKGFIVRPY